MTLLDQYNLKNYNTDKNTLHSYIENAYILKEEVSKNFDSEIIDLRGIKGRYDDIMLWVKK